ncbi:MAG: hypothetical protein OEZ68_22115 [Gammaproteobacteria bacterium]|nr:hypothetical protein [Gammaproteobacteria bacterium]MDH5803483.1 hypothetical protein [Gammaproteobacteria bacterium]
MALLINKKNTPFGPDMHNLLPDVLLGLFEKLEKEEQKDITKLVVASLGFANNAIEFLEQCHKITLNDYKYKAYKKHIGKPLGHSFLYEMGLPFKYLSRKQIVMRQENEDARKLVQDRENLTMESLREQIGILLGHITPNHDYKKIDREIIENSKKDADPLYIKNLPILSAINVIEQSKIFWNVLLILITMSLKKQPPPVLVSLDLARAFSAITLYSVGINVPHIQSNALSNTQSQRAQSKSKKDQVQIKSSAIGILTSDKRKFFIWDSEKLKGQIKVGALADEICNTGKVQLKKKAIQRHIKQLIDSKELA